MTLDEWRVARAAEIGRAIGAGELDPVALTEAYLDAAEAHSAGDQIYARLMRARALAEAHSASERAKSGMRRGPLDGVPVSWKDLFDTAGTRTEAGTRLLEGRIPLSDAAVLARATGAGLVCLGKTHMTELAFSGLGLNPITATPPNVHDGDQVAGGSSSGAAASVAHGLAAGGIGSDTAGSVRIPAVWNDLVGLKTRSGTLPLSGVVPLAPQFDTVGPLCRSVEDAALLLGAMGGPEVDLTAAGLGGVRFVVLTTLAMDDLAAPVESAFENALARLEIAGAKVVRAEAPEQAEATELAGVLFAGEGYGVWRDEIETRPDAMYPLILERFRGGSAFSAADYVAAWRRLDELREEYTARFAGFDAVLAPTCANLPPMASDLLNDPELFIRENLLALRNTRIASLMGLAALTVPTGVPQTGLMLSAPSEARLLRLGRAVETALA
ncbi:MAG: amidase family protein [Pseudomonadota bacterium]